MRSKIKSCLRNLMIAVLLLGVVGGVVIWRKVFRVVESAPFASEVEWFKYGSLGGEGKMGIPYWIWVVMPRLFPTC